VLRAAGVEPGGSSLLFGTVRPRPSSRPQPRLGDAVVKPMEEPR
jgi:hypothetical protein